MSEGIYTVKMPDIGEGVVEGEVIQWLKNVGDSLAQDEPVVVLMTDKATIELPAPHPGKLSKQYYKAGDIAIKDKPLYDIEVEGKKSFTTEPQRTQNKDEKSIVPSQPVRALCDSVIKNALSGRKALTTPPVRKLAKELDIDLSAVTGTGKEGRVTVEDLKSCLGRRHELPPIPRLDGDTLKPLQGIRRLTARHVAAAKALIPHFTWCDSVDVLKLMEFHEKIKTEGTKQNVRITLTSLFVRALSLTLKEYPDFNASFDDAKNTLVVHRQHNIGIAMKTPLGLTVPVLKDVQAMSFEETMKAYGGLRQLALDNKLKPSDMKEATITISNFGTEGGRWATPVISAPDVAILATARIHPEPVAIGTEVVIRPMLNLSWSFDHRVIDGDMAAAFSNYFIQLLANPLRLL